MTIDYDAVPQMHLLDPYRFCREFDYADMIALSDMLEGWALNSTDSSPHHRTMLICISIDLEHLASWVGKDWLAPEPPIEEYPPDPGTLLWFMAKVARKWAGS